MTYIQKKLKLDDAAIEKIAQAVQRAESKTRENSGILIFISLLERQVRIIADSGISAKISDDLWKLIADELAEGIGKRDAASAIIGAIEKCGELLAQHFPAEADNPDELSNNIIFLENPEWT